MTRLLAALAFFGCLVGCVSSGSTTLAATQAAKYGILTVRVLSNNVGVKEATVTVSGQTKITNSLGVASFNLLLRQTYNVAVSCDGYQPKIVSIWFQKSQTISVPLLVTIPARVEIIPDEPVDK